MISDAVLELHDGLLGQLRGSGRLDGSAARVIPLVEPHKKIEVPDAPTRTVVVGARGEPIAVLFVSTPVDATYVARNVEKAALAKRLLGQDLGSVILDPLAHGDYHGVSFALWPCHRPLISIRGLAYLQKRRLSGRVLDWLRGVTEVTAREPDAVQASSKFAASLARTAEDVDFPAEARDSSKRALDRLASGAWRPRFALQHKHVGGNLLLPRGRSGSSQFRRGFIVIDWAGTNFEGYPFNNLLAFARDFRISSFVLRAELMRHCRLLSCEMRDVLPYVLAALGFYRTQLGNFPEAHYRILCRNVLEHAMGALRGRETQAS